MEIVRDGAVVLAYVYTGHEVAYSWHHSVFEMLLGWEINPAHQMRVLRGGWIAMKCGTDGLAEARNKTVRDFLKEDRADWLFWTDTDMGFAADTLDRLMDAADPDERPIVGALAFTWREDDSDQMGGWRTFPVPVIFDWARIGDKTGFTVRYDYPPDTVIRCAGTGSACTLIHKSVFEKIAAEYGEQWYDRVPNPATGQIVSEDLSLCLRAGALGIPVHVHTGVRTTHQKTLWVGEGDYHAAVALEKLAAQVPPASEKTAVIVPVLWRPGKAGPFMESFNASGAGDVATVYAVADPADTETVQAWRCCSPPKTSTRGRSRRNATSAASRPPNRGCSSPVMTTSSTPAGSTRRSMLPAAARRWWGSTICTTRG